MEEKLSLEDLQELGKLVDPDAPSAHDHYKWDEEFQREILGLMLNDRPFLIEIRPLIKSEYFSNDVHSRICKLLFAHFDKYKTLPTRAQMTQLLKDELEGKKDDVQAYQFGEYNSIMSFYVPGRESRDFYRDKITHFAKTQALRLAFHQCLDAIKKAPDEEKTWDNVHGLLRDALTVEHNFDVGLHYFDTYRERYERKNKQQLDGDTFTSGFKQIDDALQNGGLLRGEMASWVGLSGTGKSLALVVAALKNMDKGKKVLYITLEIDQDAVAERFDSQIANIDITKEEVSDRGITVKNLLDKKEIVFELIEDYVKTVSPSNRQLLVIKQFPGGSMGMNDFRAYYQQSALHGFKPDLVIIDYIGEMRDYPDMQTHESRYRITRDLRGFAVEEQLCVMTAMQPNRTGKEAVKLGQCIDDENLGDSYAQVKPLDAMWTINQMADERECGLARVYVAKHRAGKSRFTFYVSINYDTLSITQISQNEYEQRLRKHRATKDTTIEDKLKNEAEVKKLENLWKEKRESKKDGTPRIAFNRDGYGSEDPPPDADSIANEIGIPVENKE
jgi:hypothetical protein